MFFQKLKLKPKLIGGTVFFVVITMFSITQYMESSWKENTTEVTKKMMNEICDRNGEKISTIIHDDIQVAQGLSVMMKSYKTINSTERRKVFNEILKNTLIQHSNLLGLWTCWEPNALDNRDNSNKNKAGHDQTGRFVPYWVRSNGQISVSPLVDYTTPGAGDYYLLAKNSGRSTITEPYLYDVGGKQVLVVTYTVPIKEDGKVVGAVGLDFSLENFQTMIESIKPYQKTAAALFTNQESIIAHVDKARVGKKVIETEADIIGDYMNQFREAIKNGHSTSFTRYLDLFESETAFQIIPIKIADTGVTWSIPIAIGLDEAYAKMNSSITFVNIISILAIIAISGIIFFLANSIIKRIQGIKKVTDELNRGNTTLRLNTNEMDEIGDMARSLDDFCNTLDGFAGTMKLVADGDLNQKVEMMSEDDRVAPGLISIIDSLQNLHKEIQTLISDAINGNLSSRGNSDLFKGGYKEMVDGFNHTLDAIIEPINGSLETLNLFSQGDFRQRITADYKGDHRKLKDTVNSMADSLTSLITAITEAIEATASASSQISSSAEEMAAGAEEQSAQSHEVATAIEQMTQTVVETSQNANLAAQITSDSVQIANEGGEVVENTVQGINKISEVVNEAASNIKALGDNSQKIGEIVQVIDDIADQTNLLALNAAIEAARAGEQGRGFAVVADEVRKLAERTTKATKEIAEMIKQIQKDTLDAVNSMDAGTQQVDKGSELAYQSGESLKRIIEGINKTLDIVNQVAAASEEQSSATTQIATNVEGINNVTQESASGTQQIAHAAEDLNALTDNLLNTIGNFKINRNGESSNMLNQNNTRLLELN
ncbi:MAG: methyl-accepting chemotaxis protein [Rhodothermaceae bacterium]